MKFYSFYIITYIFTVTEYYECHNKLPQMWRLKILQIYSHNFGDQMSKVSFTGLKSRCQKDCFLLDVPGENQFLISSGF